MGAMATIEQTRFRFRRDNGNEATADWDAAENANITHPAGQNFRVRLKALNVSGTAGTISASINYSLNGGALTPIDGSSSVVKLVDSPHLVSGSTTEQLSDDGQPFVAGFLDESAPGLGVLLSTNEETECEIVCQVVDADTSDGDTIDFKIASALSTLVFTQVPRLTVGTPAAAAGPSIGRPIRQTRNKATTRRMFRG